MKRKTFFLANSYILHGITVLKSFAEKKYLFIVALLLLPSLSYGAVLKYGDTIDYELKLDSNEVIIQSKGIINLDDRIRTSNTLEISSTTLRVFSTPQFYKEGNTWYDIDYSTTTPELFVDSQTVAYNWKWIKTAIADTIFGTGDGFSRRAVAAESFAAIRAGTGTGTGTNWDIELLYGGGWQRWGVAKGDFDTSSIPDTDTVSACTLNLWLAGSAGADQPFTMTNAASGLTAGTYTNHTTEMATEYSSADITTGATGQYYTWTCNATARAAINKTGTTYIGLRHANDFDNIEPAQANSQKSFYDSSNPGTANDPYLDITHNAGASSPPLTGSASTSTDMFTLSRLAIFYWFVFLSTILFTLYLFNGII